MSSNPFFQATNYSNYLLTDKYVFAQLGDSSGTIVFDDSYTVYFTIIGGGGGGGGGGHNNGVGSPAYPSGGGGGAGAAGMISYQVEAGKTYTYSIGASGNGGEANNSGSNGQDTSAFFSGTDYVISRGGTGGGGHFNGNVGGVGGSMEISGNVEYVFDVSGGGNGGSGVFFGDIPGTGTPGFENQPPIIQISPLNTINVGGGGGGTDASFIGMPPAKASNGGGGGNGSGGILGTGIVTVPDGSYNGLPGIAYGAGGGGAGQPGADSPVVGFNITYGGSGKEGAIFLYFEYIPSNGCQWNPMLANQSIFWTRGTRQCLDLTDAKMPDGSKMTFEDLSEKRKSTIFQYKKNSANFSKKHNYSRLARGIGKQRGASFASQSSTYTNPNIKGLVQNGRGILICPSTRRNWALTNQNNTPGPVRRITNYPTVPLYNYKTQRTYLAGGTKWPQYGPFSNSELPPVTNTSLTITSLLPSVTVSSQYKYISDVLFNTSETILIKYPHSNLRTTYTIPSSVTSIEFYAFLGASNLTDILVDANNTQYKDISGVLFNISGDTLIQYPIGNSRQDYEISSIVNTINSYSFFGATNLYDITIPPSVTSIGKNAFITTTNLKTVFMTEATSTQLGLDAWYNYDISSGSGPNGEEAVATETVYGLENYFFFGVNVNIYHEEPLL